MRSSSPRAASLSALAMLISSLAFAQEPADPRIRVTGQAEIRVVPDEVVVTFGLQTHAKTVQEAKAENDRRLTLLRTVVNGQGVAAEHVKADYLEIRPIYRDEERQLEFLSYRARRTVLVTLRDLSKFEPLVSAALDAGTNFVHGIEFHTTELRKHRDAARAAALTAAQEKARAMAAGLGRQVGAPHQIDEGYGGFYSSFGRWGTRHDGWATQNVSQAAGYASTSDTTLLPGQIAVVASVTISFELK